MNSSKNTTLHNIEGMSAGDIVQAYDCDGALWERVFWGAEGDIAYLSSPERYQRMLEGDADARPVGFRITDLVPQHG